MRTVMMRPVKSGIPLDVGSVDRFEGDISNLFDRSMRHSPVVLGAADIPTIRTCVKLFGNSDGSSPWEQILDLLLRVDAIELYVEV